MNNDLKNKVINILERNGYFFETDSDDEELYFDSLQFMTTLVDLELEFNIIIPEEYIYDNQLNNLKEYCDLVNVLTEGIN